MTPEQFLTIFRIEADSLGYYAERSTLGGVVVEREGPCGDRLTAERLLVLMRTRALRHEDLVPPDTETPEGGVPAGAQVGPGVFDVDIAALRVTLTTGEVLPIVCAVGSDGEPSLDPDDVEIVMAGPNPGSGGWLIFECESGPSKPVLAN